MIREAYEHATALFVETVSQVKDAQWSQPGLGEWNVRDLAGHTNRALLTVETYVAKPAAAVEVERPVDYFVRAMAVLADPAAVAARGREAGAALGNKPAVTVRETAARVLALVGKAPDETLVTTPVGGMRLIDYLPSRVFELTVHTLDLAAALSLNITLPETAATVTCHLLADLALQSGKVAPLLLAATGRGPLPPGFNVW